MMLPDGEENLLLEEGEIEEETLPGLTWELDEERQAIERRIDGVEALEQALRLILRTERMEHEIYSADYGVELEELIGQPIPLACVNIEENIKEAFSQDDRVEEVGDFAFERTGKNSVLATFTVVAAEGVVEMEQEVTILG